MYGVLEMVYTPYSENISIAGVYSNIDVVPITSPCFPSVFLHFLTNEATSIVGLPRHFKDDAITWSTLEPPRHGFRLFSTCTHAWRYFGIIVHDIRRGGWDDTAIANSRDPSSFRLLRPPVKHTRAPPGNIHRPRRCSHTSSSLKRSAKGEIGSRRSL